MRLITFFLFFAPLAGHAFAFAAAAPIGNPSKARSADSEDPNAFGCLAIGCRGDDRFNIPVWDQDEAPGA